MTENSYSCFKYLLSIFLVVSVFFLFLQLGIVYKQQIYLTNHIKNLHERLSRLENSTIVAVNENDSHNTSPISYQATPLIKVPDFESVDEHDGHEVEIYFDTPTSTFPRLISNGVFPLKSSEIIEYKSAGRQFGDMENVAVLIESTNWNDTKRWVAALFDQRKSNDDLPIFLYTPPINISGISYSLLKSWSDPSLSVYPVKQNNRRSAMNYVQENNEYVISVKDHEHVAEDFAEYYFIGKSVMESDENIESVCGSSNGIWQNYDLGDVLWLSESECLRGEMRSRRTSKTDFIPKTGISIRPEVARVGSSERSVVTDTTWNIDLFKPTMMTKAAFDMRLNYDFRNGTVSSLSDWDLLKTFDCSSSIYIFPYENDQQLEIYFTNMDIKNLHRYNGIIPLSLDNCRVYIASQDYIDQKLTPFFDYDVTFD